MLGAILSCLPVHAKDEKKRPNIVVVLCDDLGYGDLECYGHPKIKTPHLNRLAKGGIRFTDFYSTAPVCSPSRVGLLTGRSPNRAGVYDWIPGGRSVHMRASEVTIPQLLKKAGYATCMSGKWHCNGKFNSPQQPQPDAAGFDHWFATQNNASPSHENPRNFVRNGKPVGPMKGFSCQLVMDEALSWLKGQRAKDAGQPFFLYVAFHEPHEPVASPKKMVDDYKGVAKNVDQAHYFANVTNLDAAVGKLMKALKAMELDENTLVVFSSDNGPETLLRYGRGSRRSFGSPKPLRGMKLWTTDAGFRVAGIMRWPLQVKAGQVSSVALSALDLMPTFAGLAAGEIPVDLHLDGTDMMNALSGGKIKRNQPLFWCYYSALNKAKVAMREDDWKLLARLTSPEGKELKTRAITKANRDTFAGATLTGHELYKISSDITEKEDLAKKHPEKVRAMAARLREIYRDVAKDARAWQ